MILLRKSIKEVIFHSGEYFALATLLVWLNETPPILSTLIVNFSMSKNTGKTTILFARTTV